MSESLELKYEPCGCLEAVRKEEVLPAKTRNTTAVFLLYCFVCVCVSVITLVCICMRVSVLPSTVCRMEVVKVSRGSSEARFGEEFQTLPDLFHLHFNEGSRSSCCWFTGSPENLTFSVDPAG